MCEGCFAISSMSNFSGSAIALINDQEARRKRCSFCCTGKVCLSSALRIGKRIICAFQVPHTLPVIRDATAQAASNRMSPVSCFRYEDFNSYQGLSGYVLWAVIGCE